MYVTGRLEGWFDCPALTPTTAPVPFYYILSDWQTDKFQSQFIHKFQRLPMPTLWETFYIWKQLLWCRCFCNRIRKIKGTGKKLAKFCKTNQLSWITAPQLGSSATKAEKPECGYSDSCLLYLVMNHVIHLMLRALFCAAWQVGFLTLLLLQRTFL